MEISKYAISNGITKEQFGMDLYETVYLIGQILAIRQNTPENEHNCPRINDLMARVQFHMDRLNDAEAAEVAKKYPWILGEPCTQQPH